MAFALYEKHPKAFLVALHLFFAVLAVVGQVGENVSLPLWAGAASSNCSTHIHKGNNSNETTGEMDPFFILTFASFSFMLLFGIISLVNLLVYPKAFSKDDLKFPQWQFMLIGVCDALNGVLVVSASPSARTAPFLQAILGNITIPLTIVLRFKIRVHNDY